jgi:single-strand DNA-binding protein
MASFQQVVLMGNLGRDPEIKHTASGQAVANFSIATSEKYKDKSGEKVEKTEWHNIVIWGKLAEIVEKYVTKGSTVHLVGKLQTRKWQDKEGKDRYTTEVVCHEMTMCGGGNKSDGEPKQSAPAESAYDDSDIPF